jgi:glycosyltransferase involved in cell wall biosynthesis
MAARPRIVQVNLAPTLGGAEVFTAFVSRALVARGWPTRVLVRADADFWRDLDFGGVEQLRVPDATSAVAALEAGDIALIHGSLPAPVLAKLGSRGPVVGIAHQAIYDSSRPAYYGTADVMFGVSRHVVATLRANGVASVQDEPLFGIGEINRLHSAAAPVRGPLCEWDERKPFERLLAAAQRAFRSGGTGPTYTKRPGLTLGIVSRIARAKQFPALFDVLAPIIVAQPHVNVEIFGIAVGLKQLKALRRAVSPLGSRVRFWGHQRDVAPAYRGIDYLVTGLPDREALGLNVIESCLCGTPVLAIDAPPFTETMRDGITGFLYTDPRKDRGRHFAQLLTGIADGTRKPDIAQAPAHFAPFSFERFADRVDAAMQTAVARTVGR